MICIAILVRVFGYLSFKVVVLAGDFRCGVFRFRGVIRFSWILLLLNDLNGGISLYYGCYFKVVLDFLQCMIGIFISVKCINLVVDCFLP